MPLYADTTKNVFFYFIIILIALVSPVLSSSETKVYKVGVFDNRPIIFKESATNYSGLSIDFLESVAKKENLKFEYVHGTWKSVLSKLEKGEIDLLVGIAYKTERAKKFDFTKETLINNWGVVYRNHTSNISSLADLKGKRVALLQRSTHSRVFKKRMHDFNFAFETIESNDYLHAMQMVTEGKADAAVINRVISLLNASKFNLIETGIIFNPVEVRFASPKGRHSDLLLKLDQNLKIQKQDVNSPYHISLNKWLGSTSDKKFPRWLISAIIISVLVVIFLLLNNFIIRKKVANRTAELTESELRFRQLAENIDDVFWIGSPDWEKIYYVSPAYSKIWGNNPEELYTNPKKWLDSIHKNDVSKVIDDIKIKSSGDLSNPSFPEYRVISTSGKTSWILARAFPIYDDNENVIRIVGIAEDITNRKMAEEQISFMAHHDPLTQLRNRYSFEKELIRLVSNRENSSVHNALLYIDLDQFKVVNDTCGHAAGDKMLRRISSHLEEIIGDRGIIARLGGDEFGVILYDSTLTVAKSLSHELLEAIKSFRFTWDDKKFTVGASIGLVMIGDNQLNERDLLSAADMACYAAKESGRNRVHVYTKDDSDLLKRHGEMQWVSRINNALEDNRLILHQQIIQPLQSTSESSVCYEYLLRLLDENGKLVFPNLFLPAAERYELMSKLDRWVIENIFSHLQQKNIPFSQANNNPLAFINLSGQVFTDDDFIEFIIKQSQLKNINPRSICLEITETAAISNLKKANRFISRLRNHGFLFALDDFGTGMSSFSYLKSLNVDFLKIDGIFIKDLLKDPMNTAIVEAVNKIGHKANLKIIAEWIETVDLIDELRNIGIDYGQGYAIHKPSPLLTNT